MGSATKHSVPLSSQQSNKGDFCESIKSEESYDHGSTVDTNDDRSFAKFLAFLKSPDEAKKESVAVGDNKPIKMHVTASGASLAAVYSPLSNKQLRDKKETAEPTVVVDRLPPLQAHKIVNARTEPHNMVESAWISECNAHVRRVLLPIVLQPVNSVTKENTAAPPSSSSVPRHGSGATSSRRPFHQVGSVSLAQLGTTEELLLFEQQDENGSISRTSVLPETAKKERGFQRQQWRLCANGPDSKGQFHGTFARWIDVRDRVSFSSSYASPLPVSRLPVSMLGRPIILLRLDDEALDMHADEIESALSRLSGLVLWNICASALVVPHGKRYKSLMSLLSAAKAQRARRTDFLICMVEILPRDDDNCDPRPEVVLRLAKFATEHSLLCQIAQEGITADASSPSSRVLDISAPATGALKLTAEPLVEALIRLPEGSLSKESSHRWEDDSYCHGAGPDTKLLAALLRAVAPCCCHPNDTGENSDSPQSLIDFLRNAHAAVQASSSSKTLSRSLQFLMELVDEMRDDDDPNVEALGMAYTVAIKGESVGSNSGGPTLHRVSSIVSVATTASLTLSSSTSCAEKGRPLHRMDSILSMASSASSPGNCSEEGQCRPWQQLLRNSLPQSFCCPLLPLARSCNNDKTSSDSAPPGQKPPGSTFAQASYNQLMSTLRTLRLSALLDPLDRPHDVEVNRGSPTENEIVSIPSDKYLHALKELEAAAKHRQNHPVWRAADAAFGEGTVESLFATVLMGMKSGTVRVWEAIRMDTTDGTTFDSTSEFDENTLHIYVRRDVAHGGVAEAILHLCARALCKMGHPEAVLLESLLLDEEEDVRNTGCNANMWLLSRRIRSYLNTAPYTDLARLLANGVTKFRLLPANGSSGESPAPPASLVQVCAAQVSDLCRRRLLDEVDQIQDVHSRGVCLLHMSRTSSNAWTRLFDDACWDARSREALLFALSVGLRPPEDKVDSSDRRRDGETTFASHVRRRVADELVLLNRTSGPYSVRHPDLVTVYNELLGYTSDDTRRMFGLDLGDVCRILYNRVRGDVERENPNPGDFVPAPGSYERGKERLLSADLWRRKCSDGMFFAFPFLMNLALMATLGTGQYSSDALAPEHARAISIGAAISLPFSGAIINAVARLSSMYLHQWQHTLLLIVQMRLLVGFVFVFQPFIMALLVGTAIITGFDPTLAALSALFYFLFSLMLVFIACLFAAHHRSIWKSQQGRAVVLAQAINLSWVLILDICFPGGIPSRSMWAIHASGLALNSAIMARALLHQNHIRTVFHSDLETTSTDDVLLAMGINPECVEGSGIIVDGNDNEAHERRVWDARLSARQNFCRAVTASASPCNLPDELLPLVKRRRNQLPREEALIKWYCLQYAIPRPPPVSELWDATLSEARKTYAKKCKLDVPHRGSSLYLAVRRWMISGFFYFFAIFLDKVVLLLCALGSDAGELMDFDYGDEFIYATSWALVFFLVAAGCLEAFPLRVMAQRSAEGVDARDDACDANRGTKEAKSYTAPPRMRDADDLQASLLRSSHLRRAVYQRELLRFTITSIPLAGTLSAAGLVASVGRSSAAQSDWSIWATFTVSCASYTGMLLASFNMLFLPDHKMKDYGPRFLISVPLGFAVGMGALVTTRQPETSLLALAVCGGSIFVMTLVAIFVPGPEDRGTMKPHSATYQDPTELKEAQNSALQTSGQSWIGSSGTKDALSHVTKRAEHLRCCGLTRRVTPASQLGERITKLLHEAAQLWSSTELPFSIDPSCSVTAGTRMGGGEYAAEFTTAIGSPPKDMLQDLLEEWLSGAMELELVEERALWSDCCSGRSSSYPARFSAIAAAQETNLNAHVNTKSTGKGAAAIKIYAGFGQGVPPSDPSHLAECAVHLAEAMVHEYIEMRLGLPHRLAVLSEVVLHGPKKWSTSSILPQRVLHQIQTMPSSELERLELDTAKECVRIAFRDCVNNSDPSVCSSSAGSSANQDSELDLMFQEWVRYPSEARRTAVRRMEGRFLPGEGLAVTGALMLATSIGEACQEEMKARAKGRRTRVAAPRLSEEVEACLSKEKDGEATEGKKVSYPHWGRSFWRSTCRSLDEACRMWFLVLTADPSIDMELKHTFDPNTLPSEGGLHPFFCIQFRIVGLPLHACCQYLLDALLWRWVLFPCRPELNELRDRIGGFGSRRERRRLVRRVRLRLELGRKTVHTVEEYQGGGAAVVRTALVSRDQRSLVWVDGAVAVPEQELGGRDHDKLYDEEAAGSALDGYYHGNVDQSRIQQRLTFGTNYSTQYFEYINEKVVVEFRHNPLEIGPVAVPCTEMYHEICAGGMRRVCMEVKLDSSGWPIKGSLHTAMGTAAATTDRETLPFEVLWPNDDATFLSGIAPVHVKVYMAPDSQIMDVRWHCGGDLDGMIKEVTYQGVRCTRIYRKANMPEWKSCTMGEGRACKTPSIVGEDVRGILRWLGRMQAHHHKNALCPPTMPASHKLHRSRNESCVALREPIAWGLLPRLRSWFAPAIREGAVDYISTTLHPPAPRTKSARLELWRAWKNGTIEGPLAQLWDERLLRFEPSLRQYWNERARGRYDAAREELDKVYNQVCASSMFSVSAKDTMTHMSIRMGDLELMGPAMSSPRIHGRDDEAIAVDEYDCDLLPPSDSASLSPLPSIIRVAGLDSGTWPADCGGVSSCRRDLVDRLPRLAWTSIAEVGNTAKDMQYQFERNVESVMLVPLWGCDLDGPNERVFSNVPYGALVGRKRRTTDSVVREVWRPLLRELVKATARSQDHTSFPTTDDLGAWSRLVTKLHQYFQEYDWCTTWAHSLAKAVWREAWMSELGSEAEAESPLIHAERPTLRDLDTSLQLFARFLVVLSVPLDPTLRVYHGSHHGTQQLLGVAAKEIHGSTLIVWDHGLLWRERMKAISESSFGLFVRNSLIGLLAFSARVVFHNSDAVASCTTYSNPMWEEIIGGGQVPGTIGRDQMRSKLSPVVNGMETSRFRPKREVEETRPTAVMLSHVYDLKDVRNAILAADVIVHHYGLRSFCLLVYGSTEKDVEYAAGCRVLIRDRRLEDNVHLMGAGPATEVLPRGWVFLNSSKSEGLPLALGEAGLAGLPVVCTDVGGSFEVTSSPSMTYGAIVPPQDPGVLARAILRVMAMTDELDDGGGVGIDSFEGDPAALEQRMRDVSHRRRVLGMKYRAYVMSKFTMNRYLREHEQLIAWGYLRAGERRMRKQKTAEHGGATQQRST